MYDVHGNYFEGEQKGRMQQAVDEWEKSAKNSAGAEKNNNQIDDDDVKNIIKDNFKKISAEREKNVSNEPETVQKDEQTKAFSAENGTQKDTFKPEEFIESDLKLAAGTDPDDEPLDYESEEQAQAVLSDQSSLQTSIAVRFAGCLLCTFALVFIAAAPYFKISLPPIINAGVHPSVYTALNLALLILVGLFGFPVAVKGIAGLFKFKADADSLTSLSFFAAFLGNALTLCGYAKIPASAVEIPAASIFSSCAAAAVSFNLLGKLFLIARVKNNFKFISDPETANGGFYSAKTVEPEKARNVLRAFKGTPSIAVVRKARFLTNFLEKSYAKTPSDSASAVLAPVALVIALICAVLEILLNNDKAGAVIVFCAICAVSSPLLLEFGVGVPLYRACRRLLKQQALVAGCETVSEFGGIDAAVADAGLIFPDKVTRIYGVKTFAKHDIEQVMLYAASIASAGKSPVANALLDIFADVSSEKNLIKTVEKLTYEDEKGLSAIINKKVVLLGNRGLLRHHLIEVPSRDYELRYTANGKDVLYLAVDGEIYALIIVGYSLNEKTAAALRKLRHFRIHLLIQSSDPNITPYLLEEKCGEPIKNANMLGEREMKALGEENSTGRCTAGLAFKDMGGYVSAIISCLKLKGSLLANTSIQIIFSVIGMLLVIYSAFFAGGAASISPAYILAYQAMCALPVLLISLFRRL